MISLNIKFTKNSLLLLLLLVSVSFFAQEKKWTLQECVNYAVENNSTVKQSENA
jgi:outer membrane protein